MTVDVTVGLASFFRRGLVILPLVAMAIVLASIVRLAAPSSPRGPAAQAVAQIPDDCEPAVLLLRSDAIVLPVSGGQTRITAVARDAQGTPVEACRIDFNSEEGSFSSASILTGADGTGSTIFTAGNRPGQALLEAHSATANQRLYLQLEAASTLFRLNLIVDSARLRAGESTNVTVALQDSNSQPLAGELVTFFGSLGEMTPGSQVTDRNGQAFATFKAGRTGGQASIVALAGQTIQTVTLVIQSSPPTVEPPKVKLYVPLLFKDRAAAQQ